jgi:hypothetical protein
MTANPISQEATSLLGTAERRVAAVAVCGALVLGALGFSSWLEARDDRVRLSATVASQGSLIAAAEKREQDRAQELADTLKQIAALKASVQTPQQVIREMPQFLPPLPQPLESIPAKPSTAASGAGGGGTASSGTGPAMDKQNVTNSGTTQASAQPGAAAAQDVRVPAADLKPLFDFVQDCRACQAKLTSAQQDAQDEHAKNDALTKERDAAVKAAKGGAVWTRTVRAAKWLAIGFAVGYVAHAGIH